MKGIIFVELIDFLESALGMDVVDDVIETANLPSGAAYTAVGTYPASEVLTLLNTVEAKVGMSVADQQAAFGKHLFGRLAKAHPEYIGSVGGGFELIGAIEDHIHVEVRKLYPDAELPSFEYGERTDDSMVLIYRSQRPMADLCEGLIRGCFAHFNEQVEIARENLPSDGGTHVRFGLKRVG